MAKYKTLVAKRAEKGMVLKLGTVTDLSHYTPDEREKLVKEGQYVKVEEPVKAVK